MAKKNLNEQGLTPLQATFLSNLSMDENFANFKAEGMIWCDGYADTLENTGIMTPMQAGAMITTLAQKGILTVGSKSESKSSQKYFVLTPMGVEVVNQIGGVAKRKAGRPKKNEVKGE